MWKNLLARAPANFVKKFYLFAKLQDKFYWGVFYVPLCIYRLLKKTPPFYFFNNFYKFLYFFTKFGIQVAKEFLHMCGKFHNYSIKIGRVIGILKKFLKIQSEQH